LAHAGTITVDATGDVSADNAGPPNTITLENISSTFATGLTGDSFVFDIVLNDHMHAHLGTGVVVGSDPSNLAVQATQTSGNGLFFYTVTAWLSDEFGARITDIVNIASSEAGPVPGFTVTDTAFGSIPEFDNVVFHDYHIIVDTLLLGGSGTLEVEIAPTWTFESTTGEIGEWGTVPEPSSMVLLGIGGIAVVGYGVRRKRQLAA